MDIEQKKINYWTIALFYGLVCATIPIIITEIIWDSVAAGIGLTGLTRDLISDFLRAALLEEGFKFLGFRLADRRFGFTREREYMLGAGTIGLVYGVVEKVVQMNPFSIILGIVIPMHVLWQANQGRHFYAFRTAKAQGDPARARKELFLATGMIFLMHGCWDAMLDIASHFMNSSEAPGAEAVGGILLAVTVILGGIYMFFTIKKAVRVIKASRNAEAA